MRVQDVSLRKNTLIGVSSIFFSLHAVASANYLDLTLEQLLDIPVLSVSKKVEALADASAAIYVITSEDIARSGITTIPDALRMVPGVDVARSDSNSCAISIRGFNSALANKLLVLIDGRTVYNPVFGGVLWEAHDLMLEDIARIEVVRGPGGTLWGANAVNGVINITTKHARDTQGNLASAVYGNEELGTASMRHGEAFGDDGFYRVYAKAFKRDSSHRPSGGDAYDEWGGVRGGFRADWDDKFTLQGDAYRNTTQQRKPHYSLIPPYAPVENQTIIYDGVNVLGRWTDKFSDGSQFNFQSYVDWARRDEPLNFIDDRTIYDTDAQYNFAPLGIHEVVVGAGFRYLADNETGNHNVSFSPKKRRNSLYSTFAQDKITLAPDKWFLTLGSKFEHNEYSGYETQPNVRLQWQPTAYQTVWSAVSHAVRTPTPIEEDFTGTLQTAAGVRAAFVPNENFKSEELTAYEIGYRHQITSTLSTDISAFYNDYDHLETISIQTPIPVINGIDPPHFLLPFMFTNNMKGKSHGVEAVFSWLVSEDLKVTFDYSFLRLSLEAVDPTQKGAEQLYPDHQAGVKVFWNIVNDWTFDTTASYVDKLPGGMVDDYVRLDINVGARINKSLTFNLVGQDLLDNRHREFGAANDLNAGEIERSIFGKLTFEF